MWARLSQDVELVTYPVNGVWSIGWSKTETLKKQGIAIALGFKQYPLNKAKNTLP
jgi:hypothetical protein